MIEIRGTSIAVSQVDGSNYRLGYTSFGFHTRSGETVSLEMKALRFAISVIAHVHGARSMDELWSAMGGKEPWVWGAGASTPVGSVVEAGALPEIGAAVRTRPTVVAGSRPIGMLVKPEYLDVRKPNATGTYAGWVPGHDGGVWWVVHEGGEVAAYAYDEVDVPQCGSRRQ